MNINASGDYSESQELINDFSYGDEISSDGEYYDDFELHYENNDDSEVLLLVANQHCNIVYTHAEWC